MGAGNWGIHLLENHYLDNYPKDKLVYLTGDADEDIAELDKEYIENTIRMEDKICIELCILLEGLSIITDINLPHSNRLTKKVHNQF